MFSRFQNELICLEYKRELYEISHFKFCVTWERGGATRARAFDLYPMYLLLRLRIVYKSDIRRCLKKVKPSSQPFFINTYTREMEQTLGEDLNRKQQWTKGASANEILFYKGIENTFAKFAYRSCVYVHTFGLMWTLILSVVPFGKVIQLQISK